MLVFILIILKNYFILIFKDASANYLNGTSTNKIKCVPQKGDWQGGDEVVMIMPTPVKQKGF